jgi:hypothetical protein
MRLAVVGLYNSGSTAVAGMLHRLGANMGAPFWVSSRGDSPNNYYEPYDLAWHLRNWWLEPKLIERVSAAHRVCFLQRWMELQECIGVSVVGAKHPLLSLCIPYVQAAWGADVRLIWSFRPLPECIAGLEARGWFGSQGPKTQQWLWNALHEAELSTSRIIKLDWHQVVADPAWAARELATLAGLDPSAGQLQSASSFVRRPTQSGLPQPAQVLG